MAQFLLTHSVHKHLFKLKMRWEFEPHVTL